MKKLLFLFGFIAINTYAFADVNKLRIIDGEVFDSAGVHYVNESKYWTKHTAGNFIKVECPPLAMLINPAEAPNFEKYPDFLSHECVIKNMTDEGYYKEVIGPLPSLDETFFDERFSAASGGGPFPGCNSFIALAGAGRWSPSELIMSHIGTMSFKINYWIYGATAVNAKVLYWGTAEHWVNTIFSTEITITTGNAASSVYIAFHGLILGSNIEGMIC